MTTETIPLSITKNAADDLRGLMTAHELTQRDVAELASVSIKTVEGWLAAAGSASKRAMHARHLRSIRLALPGFIAARRGRKA